MNRMSALGAIAIVGTVLLAVPMPARADFMPTIDFTAAFPLSVGNLTLGYKFGVGASPFTVTAIGLEVVAPPHGQNVRIYKDGASVNLLVQSILSTDPANSSGKYQYETLAVPLVLSANTTYEIVFDAVNGDRVDVGTGVPPSSDVDISYFDSVLGVSDGAFPTSDFTHSGAYFGPAFQGTTEATAVPEPSAACWGLPLGWSFY
jgi:hypothetical protein